MEAAIVIRVNKVVRVAEGERPEAWAAALGEAGWVERAAVLKEDGGSWVRRGMLLGRDVVVKCRVLNTLGRRVKAAIGMGHGAKHWRGAERLKKAGIATGTPLMLGRVSVDGVGCEVLVLEYVEGKTLLEVLDEIVRGVGPGVREQHAVAREVATTLAKLRAWGVWNRDHKPSNLIVRTSGTLRPQIALIDCVGLHPATDAVEQDCLARMLASLSLEAIGCGVFPRRALWMRVLRSTPDYSELLVLSDSRRWLINRVARIVAEHGDPRPRMDPLKGNRQAR